MIGINSGPQSLYEFVYQMAINAIENESRKNEQRYLYHQYMSTNGYSNQEMGSLVDLMTKHVELADATRGQRCDDQAIHQIVVNWIASHLCVLVVSNPEMQKNIPPGDVGAIRQAAANYQNKVNETLRDHRQLTMSGGNGQFGGGGGNAIAQFTQQQQNRPQFQQQQQQPRQISAFQSAFSAGQPRTTGGADRTTGSSVQQPIAPAVQQPVQATRGAAAFVVQSHQLEPAVKADTAVPTTEGPDYRLPQPFDVFQIAGEVWMPAHKATYTLAGERRYKLFDPSKHILYLVRGKDGNVREEFMDINAESEYLRNELRKLSPAGVYDPSLDGSHEDSKRFLGRMDKRTYVHPSVEILDQLQDNYKQLRGKIMTAKTINPIVIASKNDAIAHVRAKHLATGDAVTFGTYITEDPVVFRAGKGVVLSDLNRNPIGLAAELIALRSRADKTLVRKIDQRLGEMLKTMAREGLGWSGANLDSFAEDVGELFEAVRARHGQQTLSDFTHALRSVISAALSVNGDEQRKREWCNDTLSMEYDPAKFEVVLFEEMHVIAYTSIKASMMFPGIMPTYSRLSEQDHKEQHEICKELLDLRDSLNGVYPAVLLTDDGETVSIARNPITGDISVRLA